MGYPITGKVHRDRRLLTGDIPLASNNLGKLVAETLLADVARGDLRRQQTVQKHSKRRPLFDNGGLRPLSRR